MEEEFKSLNKNKTWTLVPRPPNKELIGCKWVFNIKNDASGNPIRYKARLVAKGYTQQYQVDYDETFAPVAGITSFRFLLAIANKFNLKVHHMDVKTAFLNGKLDEEIYMRAPEGMPNEENMVCKLNKSLYGLKQAARCWFIELDKVLREMDFVESPVDRCIYTLRGHSIQKNVYIILYVNDLVIITGDNNKMTKIKEEISLFLGIRRDSRFKIQ